MQHEFGIVDTFVSLPNDPNMYANIKKSLRDSESLTEFTRAPTQYMFKDIPHLEGADPVDITLREMDRHGIERALLGCEQPAQVRAHREHSDRFIASCSIDPHRGMDDVRKLVRLHEEFGVRACATLPSAGSSPTPIDHARYYPFYSKCVELGVSMWVCVGVPGPRLPMAAQKVELIDQVMYDFPDLVFVMRHGAEPWEELAVKLMLKWPNLYYSTSAFSPKYYPKAIVDYANTRGSDKIIFAGYFAAGLSYERVMGELQHVPFREHVWKKFLRDNALRVLGAS